MEDKWQEDKWRNDGKPGDREWRIWEDFINAPWEPPASLEAALSKVHGPRIWLSHAVDIMAFGDEGAPIDPEVQTKKRGYIMEVAARRCRASRALCRAAQSGALTVIGAGDYDSDASEKISSDYFDTPRQLGSENNSLETDPDSIPAERPMSARHGHTKWFNVRFETNSLLVWLWSVVRTDPPQGRSDYIAMVRRGKGKTHNSVFDAMEEVWPDHRVPKILSVKEIGRKIETGLKNRHITKKSDDEIRRILGKK
jgi:hypothetical protein